MKLNRKFSTLEPKNALFFDDHSFSSIFKKYYNSLSIMNCKKYDKSKRKEAKLKLLLNRVKKYITISVAPFTHDTTTLHLSSKLLVDVCTQEYYELTNHFDLQNLLTQAVLLSQLHEG